MLGGVIFENQTVTCLELHRRLLQRTPYSRRWYHSRKRRAGYTRDGVPCPARALASCTASSGDPFQGSPAAVAPSSATSAEESWVQTRAIADNMIYL